MNLARRLARALWSFYLRKRYCSRGEHRRESDWTYQSAYQSIYCLDCGKLLVLRQRPPLRLALGGQSDSDPV